jgi:hypothetical protein
MVGFDTTKATIAATSIQFSQTSIFICTSLLRLAGAVPSPLHPDPIKVLNVPNSDFDHLITSQIALCFAVVSFGPHLD